jgi:hypothetical protein
MANILNQPSEETFERVALAIETIAKNQSIADYTNSPGSKYLWAGDKQAGFFGIVPSGDFIDGLTLATELGITSGTAMESDSAWIKYIYKGRIRFTPLRPFRHSITWDAIYNAGAVYGDGTIGTLPPAGRMGAGLTIDSSDNSINTTTQFFLSGTDSSDTVANVGDTISLANWSNSANNGTATVDSITNTKIVVSGKTLVSETGGINSKIYKTSNAISQNAVVTIGANNYKVMLIGGFENDPFLSGDSDRDAIGSEWNEIILPLHERAKLQNWNYTAYAGTTQYWGLNLSDFDLRTHNQFGVGSYTWTKEVRDLTTWRRGYRGYVGASYAYWGFSFYVHSFLGWRPVLELL